MIWSAFIFVAGKFDKWLFDRDEIRWLFYGNHDHAIYLFCAQTFIALCIVYSNEGNLNKYNRMLVCTTSHLAAMKRSWFRISNRDKWHDNTNIGQPNIHPMTVVIVTSQAKWWSGRSSSGPTPLSSHIQHNLPASLRLLNGSKSIERDCEGASTAAAAIVVLLLQRPITECSRCARATVNASISSQVAIRERARSPDHFNFCVKSTPTTIARSIFADDVLVE